MLIPGREGSLTAVGGAEVSQCLIHEKGSNREGDWQTNWASLSGGAEATLVRHGEKGAESQSEALDRSVELLLDSLLCSGLNAAGHGYKWPKWVSIAGWLPSPLEIRWEVWSRGELGGEPLLHCIERNQLRWFRSLVGGVSCIPKRKNAQAASRFQGGPWGPWGALGTAGGNGWQEGALGFPVKDTAPMTWTQIRCRWQRKREIKSLSSSPLG